MIRRLSWGVAFLAALLVCLVIARRVPLAEGGLLPAGLLLLATTAVAIRRLTIPRSGRPA